MNAEDFYKQEFEKDYELIKDIRNTPVFNLDSVLKFAELYAVKGNTVSGVVFLVSRYNDGEHPSSDVVKIFQNRIDAEQFVEEMKEKHKDNISFKYKHFYFEIDEMDVN